MNVTATLSFTALGRVRRDAGVLPRHVQFGGPARLIEQQWSVLNTARDTSCYTRHEAVLVSCCTTLTIAHSDAFRAHDDHTLAERVDSQDTAEYALSRSSSLDDDARSGSPPRPRRTRTARRRVNNRKGYLRELVGGHWRRKAHCKRSIDALTCVCKQEELARPDLFEPPVWPVSPPLPIRDFGNW